jgi:hypothetical protein
MEAVQSTAMKEKTFTTKKDHHDDYCFWHVTFCTSANKHMLPPYAGKKSTYMCHSPVGNSLHSDLCENLKSHPKNRQVRKLFHYMII